MVEISGSVKKVLRQLVGCQLMVGWLAAKEVGMGNPAEKTTNHPTAAIVGRDWPYRQANSNTEFTEL